MSNLVDKKIILAVSGSVACYKAVDLASKLAQAGAVVDVILTGAAERFVSPLAFSSVTGRRAFTDADLWGGESHVLHVGLGHGADLLLMAPCTANTMAKMANGIADNLVTITALAAGCPVLLAPAMDAGMYEHPATAENVEKLRQRSVLFAGPAVGRMASGLQGLGRMLEPAEILGWARVALGAKGPLAGRKVVVTAGGSRQAIDPVRYIGNRSSGKQGYAIAQAAIDAGAQVVLVSHPTGLAAPIGSRLVLVEDAAQMERAVMAELEAGANGLVMAAAVADFTPAEAEQHKIKKGAGERMLRLAPTKDILAEVAQLRERLPDLKAVFGFAAESRDLLRNAAEKLRAKKLDMIAANDIGASDAGFGSEDNRVSLLLPDGSIEELPLMAKEQVAERIVVRLAAALK